ncbi:D-alanyl-D-alanine carboxypeptidase family protein [Ferrovum sp.]|uniref:D-alanyl-D-alanine carboxypeptidase family protein n=1 Tax=Ferrovum sp. TaxID=2609467 RepID=UPI00263366D4|nr:D-alanyl-D-alanine carboxypeptidase family protein [Ferrovum sp.]
MRLFFLMLLWVGGATAVFADSPLVAPFIAARAYTLVEVESNQPLASLNPDQRMEPASLTKLMTAYLVFKALREQKIHPEQRVFPSDHAWHMPGSRMFIQAGKAVSVTDLLHGLIIESGNDAGVALAETVDGTEEKFVERMNAMAHGLGMENTHFVNATGLPDQQHYSTAHDLGILAQALIRDFPEYYPLYGQKEYTYDGITQPNRNRLLWIDHSVDGLKTGHTDSAGYCLIASARRGERRLLAVVLGTNSDLARTSESQKLLNWGFQAFESRILFRQGVPVRALNAYKGGKPTVSVGFGRDIWVTTPVGHEKETREVLTTLQPVIAPVDAGQKVGSLKVYYAGQWVNGADLVALESIPAGNVFTRSWDAVRLMLK